MKSIVIKLKGLFQKPKVDYRIPLNINGNNPESVASHSTAGFLRVSIFEEDMLKAFKLMENHQHRVVKIYYK